MIFLMGVPYDGRTRVDLLHGSKNKKSGFALRTSPAKANRMAENAGTC
jgi:hypothetical protein